MAIGTSNTFVLTSASTALSAFREQINGSLQSLAQNFYSDARPVAANFQDDGGSTVAFTDSRASGILHYNSSTNALYVNVPTADKKGGEGPGGNFTRVGIGARYEDNIVGATANIGTYQIGELVVNLDSSNVRLMVKGANSASNFIDVGIPPTNGSVTSAMFAAGAVTTAKITDANIEWKRVGKGDASSLTLREPQLAQARAVLAAAEAAYEQSKRNLRRTVILAPFDGRVRKKMVDIGANLVPGSRIADIYNTLNLEVRLPIADKDIPFLGVPLDGTSLLKAKRPSVALTTSYGGDTFQSSGFIVRAESQIDPKTRMISVIATIPMNTMNEKLKVGMFVNAEIDGLLYDGITIVPRSAVKNDMIWVVETNVLRKKSVEVIRYEKDFAFIADGLEKNDRVLTTRLDSYVDGMPVREN